MLFYNAAVTKDEYLQREREYIYIICIRDVTYLRFFFRVIYILSPLTGIRGKYKTFYAPHRRPAIAIYYYR